MSGTSNTAIGDDARRFLVDGSGNVCVGDEAGTGLGARVSNCLTAQLKEQAAQIQKVSAQLEMSKPAAESGREQTLAVVHHNYGIIVCS